MFSNTQSGKQNELYCAYQTGKHCHFSSSIYAKLFFLDFSFEIDNPCSI